MTEACGASFFALRLLLATFAGLLLAAGIWFFHTKPRGNGISGVSAQDPGRLRALGWEERYGFDYTDHSVIEVGGRVYDGTYGVSAGSWSDYFSLMVRQTGGRKEGVGKETGRGE